MNLNMNLVPLVDSSRVQRQERERDQNRDQALNGDALNGEKLKSLLAEETLKAQVELDKAKAEIATPKSSSPPRRSPTWSSRSPGHRNHGEEEREVHILRAKVRSQDALIKAHEKADMRLTRQKLKSAGGVGAEEALRDAKMVILDKDSQLNLLKVPDGAHKPSLILLALTLTADVRNRSICLTSRRMSWRHSARRPWTSSRASKRRSQSSRSFHNPSTNPNPNRRSIA